jgi:hypothetical protein
MAHAAERRISVRRGAAATVEVACPVGQKTRIVFPEPLRSLKGLGVARAALGLSVEQAAPVAILAAAPPTHPARGTIEFQGSSLEVRLGLSTTTEGAAEPLEVTIVIEPEPDEGPANAEEPSDAPPSTDAPPARSPEALDLAALLSAKTIRIDRREGLPGQPELRLTDALRAEHWVFFRFHLEDGAKGGVKDIAWDDGQVKTFVTEPQGDDLLIVVQLPRERVSNRSRIRIETGDGLVYEVATRAPTLPGRFRDLFR